MAKVFVGLSGGVDSAVSAALLKRQGHDVTGVFIKIWQPEFLECTWREDRLDAMRAAVALNIPFREVDLSEQYKKEVIDTMLSTYRLGRTPNPDVLCNQSIKFGSFLDWAIDQGAEKVATGHYARTRVRDRVTQLLRGRDTAKDQSYFLHRIGRDAVARAMFPIGEMTKSEVRAAAHSFSLPVAARPDSQGLCFVGDVSMSDFLKRYITVEEGPVVDENGKTIGVHEGAVLYTIGQRHGFRITDPTASAVSRYVVQADVEQNTLMVSSVREHAATAEITVESIQWLASQPHLPLKLHAQARYREAPIELTLSQELGDVKATFARPHIVSSGQALVFYDGDVCLGGGVMRRDTAQFVHNEAQQLTTTVQ